MCVLHIYKFGMQNPKRGTKNKATTPATKILNSRLMSKKMHKIAQKHCWPKGHLGCCCYCNCNCCCRCRWRWRCCCCFYCCDGRRQQHRKEKKTYSLNVDWSITRPTLIASLATITTKLTLSINSYVCIPSI